jgi:hypothetical protein
LKLKTAPKALNFLHQESCVLVMLVPLVALESGISILSAVVNISEKSAAVETGKLLRNITRKNILILICQSEAFSASLGPNLSQQLHYFSLMKPALQIFC